MRDRSIKRILILTAVCIILSVIMNTAYADDLWDAINNAASSGYTLSGDYLLPEGKSSLGELQSLNFTLEGNKHTIDLNSIGGVYIDSDKTMIIRNTVFKNGHIREGKGGAIYNDGTITSISANFSDNQANDDGGAIYSKGDVTVNAINKDVEFAGNYDDSSSITNAVYMAGTAENPLTLALNSKNSENEVSINDKLDGSYYNIVINDAENCSGDVVFYNEVNTGSLTISKGLLENNGIVTAASGANNGTISYDSTISGVKGDFILNDGAGATPLVFNNNGSFTKIH